jgi:putative ABC transport system ATP-binding protein
MKKVLEMKGIKKTYHMGEVKVLALKGVDVDIYAGEFISIVGHSGSGKSTLMNIMGCLDTMSGGEYYFEGRNINSLNPDEYADIRNQKIGFVFQTFNLLPRTTALENVELPLFYDRLRGGKNGREKAAGALKRVGLEDRMYHSPNELSGGQRQRVALARALVNEPSIVLADEPTGNVDSRTSVEIIALFQELNKQGVTIVMVTHEFDLVRYTERLIRLRDGRVIEDRKLKKVKDAKEDLDNWHQEQETIEFVEES